MKIKAALSILFSLCFFACQKLERSVEGSVESHFSAQDGIEWVVEREIDRAVDYIDAAVYTFTSRPLAQALVDAHNRGVEVRLVLDPSSASSSYGKATYLYNNGIEIKIEKGAGLMHHKFLLIDDSVLITGSFNWTASAESINDENIILLKGFPSTFRSYMGEFKRLWGDGRTYTGKLPEVCDLSALDVSALRKNVGNKVKVCGKVIRVGHSRTSETYFIDFTKNRKGFTAVIFPSALEKFEVLGLEIEDYKGEYVAISGELIEHPKYGLEIIVEAPFQIQILK